MNGHDVDLSRRATEHDGRRLQEIRALQLHRSKTEISQSRKQGLGIALVRDDDDVHVVCETRVAVKADRVAADDQEADLTCDQAP